MAGKVFNTLLILLVLATSSYAQSKRFEIAYNFASYGRQGRVSLYGGSIGMAYRVNRTWGIVGDLDAREPSERNFSVVQYRGGPRFHYVDKKHIAVWSQFLVGGSRISVPFFGAHTDGLSLYSGAGLDVGIKPWLAWRAVDVGVSSFRIDKGWSNGFRIGTGVVFRFGKMD